MTDFLAVINLADLAAAADLANSAGKRKVLKARARYSRRTYMIRKKKLLLLSHFYS
jgi:hypothetical protein